MEMAQPSTTSAHVYSASPPDYQALGTAITIAKDASTVCLRADSATIEVTALAPDLFRVGFFPLGRSVDYRSLAVVSQDWHSVSVTIGDRDRDATVATSPAA